MRRFDDHPDELLDRERQGALGPGDAEELASHRAVCAACALEVSMAVAPPLASLPGDDALLSRLVDRAVDGAAGTAAGAGGLGKLLAVTVVVAGGALLAWFAVPSPAAPPHRAARAAAPRAPTRPASAGTAEPAVANPAPALRPVETEPPNRTAAPAAPPARREAPDEVAPRGASPAELFRQANEARRAGRVSAAADLYRQLGTAHASTEEAIASHVALGRLLLDRLGDPAGAHARFLKYLAARPDGTLAEEARIGRALALGRLGARDAERAAWQELLARHPSSVHADRARTRLLELEQPPHREDTP